MLLVVFMLVFDGGIHSDPEFFFFSYVQKIWVNCLLSVDGDMICASWLIGQAHDGALIDTITAGSR